MKLAVKRKWQKALTSGKYKQGLGRLRRDNKFCCLGVLCDVYAKEHPKSGLKWDRHYDTFGGRCGALPMTVKKWAGVNDALQGALIKANDSQLCDFNDIAMALEGV